MSQKLEIGYQRICDCEPNRLNCLTPKEWLMPVGSLAVYL